MDRIWLGIFLCSLLMFIQGWTAFNSAVKQSISLHSPQYQKRAAGVYMEGIVPVTALPSVAFQSMFEDAPL